MPVSDTQRQQEARRIVVSSIIPKGIGIDQNDGLGRDDVPQM